MNISTDSTSLILKSIESMNEMLKSITAAEMNLSHKITKATVTAKVTGLGENIDISV